MTWAKLDDRYDDNRKVRAALRRSPLAAALHAHAITACARHESDGVVDALWLEDHAPDARKRNQAVSTLLELQLFDRLPSGESITLTDQKGYEVCVGPFSVDALMVHDFLDFNDSSAYLQEKRRRDAARKANGRQTDSARSPRGQTSDSKRTDAGFQAESALPVPSRPVPITTPTGSPNAYSGDQPSTAGHLDEDDQSFADRVCGVLQRGVDSLTSEEARKLPTPAAVAEVLLRCRADRDAALAAAVAARSICQSQNRAPNIVALFEQQLKKHEVAA